MDVVGKEENSGQQIQQVNVEQTGDIQRGDNDEVSKSRGKDAKGSAQVKVLQANLTSCLFLGDEPIGDEQATDSEE